MRLRTKVIVALASLAGLLLVTYVAALSFLIFRPQPDLDEWFRPRSRQRFSREAWRQTRPGDAARLKMANDLLAARRLLGRSREEIIALLGEPAWEEPRGTETTLNYELVAQRDFPAKCFLLPNFLFLNFETWLLEIDCRNGRVRSAKIHRRSAKIRRT